MSVYPDPISYLWADGEKPTGAVDGLNTLYTLTHLPISGSIHCYIAGLRLDPANFSVAGLVVTILTATVGGGLVVFDYRYRI